MSADLLPPPEAALIRELREKPPKMSKRKAAELAGISEAWWRTIENGYKHFRGQPYAERGNAQTVARMAHVVGATPGQLTAAGRGDAAAELEAIIRAAVPLTPGQRRGLAGRIQRDTENI